VSIYHGESSPDNITMLGADVFVTDPPYGVGFKGKKTKDTKRVDGGYASTHDTPENVIDVVVPIVAAMVENTVRGAVTPGSRMMFDYPKPDGVGAIFHPSGAGLGKWGFTCWQPVFYYGKCPYLENGMGLRPDSIRSPESAERLGHPCPKPLKTMQFIVRKVNRGRDRNRPILRIRDHRSRMYRDGSSMRRHRER